MIRITRNALVLALTLACANSGAASLHRCAAADGSIAFSDKPCPELPKPTKAGAFDLELLIVNDQAEKDAYVKAVPAERKGKGRLRSLKVGPKYLFPVVVENYRPAAGEQIYFVADVTLTTPDGKATTYKKVSGFVSNNPGIDNIRYAVLDPILNLQFDKTDKPGRYQIQASVIDAAQNAVQTATEWFELAP